MFDDLKIFRNLISKTKNFEPHHVYQKKQKNYRKMSDDFKEWFIITLFKRHVTMENDMILHRAIMTESTVYINTFVF